MYDIFLLLMKQHFAFEVLLKHVAIWSGHLTTWQLGSLIQLVSTKGSNPFKKAQNKSEESEGR